MNNKKYKFNGMWPVAPTPFHNNGEVDYDGMERVLDCIVDQQVQGICILANYSEQFLLSDEEREKLTKLCMKKIDGRVKTIVTVSHFATDIVKPRAELAKSLGADIIMMLPPYHGQLKGNEAQIYEQFEEISKVKIPIMVQDAPLSGIELTVPLLTKMINEIEYLTCFKIESTQAASKIRALIKNCESKLDAPFDGEESITLYADLEAGISGSMSSALLTEKIAPVIDYFLNNEKEKAEDAYNYILPLINFENRQCGFRGTKTVMKEGGVIKSDFCRHPIKPLYTETKKLLFNFAKKYDLLTYKWGK
ncbi:dihydrodipicolinate synthase family protein [Alphaproteobacteria bacterium]|nr:dihydrodipicolinate synthase family protein [Alphaproteobacteria bacterium]MDC3270182.1 dihydrodipicolinate synthase family protein [Alphaproteobacteria bacterium]